MIFLDIDKKFSFLPRKYRHYIVPSIISSLIVVVTVVVAGYIYTNIQEKRISEINTEFWKMSSSIDNDDIDTAKKHFATIMEQGQNEQVVIAAMLISSAYFREKNYQEAEKLYSLVINLTRYRSLRDVARIRLSKVLLELNQPEDASDLILELEGNTPFIKIIAPTLLGDIYLTQNNLDDASFSYYEALSVAESLGDQNVIRLLEDKRALLTSLRLQQGVPAPIRTDAGDFLGEGLGYATINITPRR